MTSFYFVWAKILRSLRGAAIRTTHLDASSRIHSGSAVRDCTIDRHSFIGYDCTFYNCSVGPFCSIANRVTVGGVAHPAHFVSTSPVFLSHKDSIKTKFAKHSYLPVLHTQIGPDVWIGEGAFIKAGVIVGPGAIIGMGAVVTRDVPPYAIVAGNPAKLIRFRFEDDIVNGLLEMRWWELPDIELKLIGHLMNCPRDLLIERGFL